MPSLDRMYAFGVPYIFWSTYLYEQVFFPILNYNKSKHRWRLTDESLQFSVKMKVTIDSPYTDTLCSEVQEQKSH